MQRHLLGNAMRRAAHRAGDVGAVAVAVARAPPVVDGGVTTAHAPGELLMGRADAGVDDVSMDAGAVGRVVVAVVERQIALVDAVKPPGGGGLGHDGAHHLIRLDIAHVGISHQGGHGLRGHHRGKTLQGSVVDKEHFAAVARDSVHGQSGGGDGAAIRGSGGAHLGRRHDHDVLVRDRRTALGDSREKNALLPHCIRWNAAVILCK